MNARSIALIASFSAVAIALNTIGIPAIFLPGFSYHFNEIPIVVAFLLFGPKIGALVGVFHLAGQLALFPIGPVGIVAYPMGFVALVVMVLGVFLASRLISRRATSEKPFNEKRRTTVLTVFAVAFRGGIMPFLDYGVMYRVLLPLVLGISIPEASITALVPSFILYNVTVPLYTIPLAYITAAKVSKYLKIESHLINDV